MPVQQVNFTAIQRPKPTDELVKKVVSDDKNYINEGRHSAVYNIPHMPQYVLKINKSTHDRQIIKKVAGEPLQGIEKQYTYSYIDSAAPEDGQRFLKQTIELSELPLESYHDFAKKIKAINKKGYTLDVINPNNVLFDRKKKELNPVDFEKKITDSDDTLLTMVTLKLIPCSMRR